jgi:tRNA(Leu) C34 or U34 (ribose-2'-O)-methylase TrmL
MAKEFLEKAASAVCGKKTPPKGITPAVLLVNPKFDHNVGMVVRAASCYRVPQVWWTGNRVSLDVAKGERLPREERMKGYRDVEMVQFDYPFDHFGRDVTPVAVEVRPNSECIYDFVHPEKALYVFGPEDGGLSRVQLQHCHRFVTIPTAHCANLAAAVWQVLFHRALTRNERHNRLDAPPWRDEK